MPFLRVAILFLAGASLLAAAKPLRVYFIDVEGGQATLVVAPSGQSMLIDAGWSGREGRDRDRILATAKKAGARKLDYLVVTHYHEDHVGGVPQLAEKLPVATFVDHGEVLGSDQRDAEFVRAYRFYSDKAKRMVVKPGDTIPLRDLQVDVVSSAGAVIAQAMPGAAPANPACEIEKPLAEPPSENTQSVGLLVTYGRFRLLDLADLTWDKELELMCPVAKLPPVDVWVASHHGGDRAGSRSLVHAIRPRVAIVNNGARKGGAAEAWRVLREAPGIEDIWRLHFWIAGGRDGNPPDVFIANTQERCEGQGLWLEANPDGGFKVVNTRNNYARSYAAR